MKLELVMADPAGNRTALVLTQVPPQDRGPFAARLMELPELGAEQVGFVLPPPSGGLFRLEMMGGEFCGNAARSFGLYVARKLGRTGKLLVEVSGSGVPVPVEADPAHGWEAVPRDRPQQRVWQTPAAAEAVVLVSVVALMKRARTVDRVSVVSVRPPINS